MTLIPLPDKLQRVLQVAAENPGVWQTFRTTDNLKIDIMLKDRYTHLRLSRTGHYPTLQEWVSVTRSFPYPLRVKPSLEIAYGRYYLQATWTDPANRTPQLVIPSQK